MIRSKVGAVVLAGCSDSSWGPLTEESNIRALATLKGRRLLDYSVAALLGSGYIDKIVVVFGRKVAPLRLPANVQQITETGDITASVLAGAKALGMPSEVLYLTDDAPFMTGDAVADFLTRCAEKDADGYFPFVGKEACLAKYPDLERTFFKLQEGSFTGGNIFLLKTAILEKFLETGRKMFAIRKHPLQLAAMLGPVFSAKFALGKLSISMVENRIDELLHFQARIVVSPYAEVAEDFDKASEFGKAEKYIKETYHE
jgi:molybdopterin-guanine dinucleotide biosynthesis protein A